MQYNRFNQNVRFYHNPNHAWYYFKDLGNDEAIMMIQTDSDIEGGGGECCATITTISIVDSVVGYMLNKLGVAHSSFFNPNAHTNARPRESIELRAFIYFA